MKMIEGKKIHKPDAELVEIVHYEEQGKRIEEN